MFTKSFFVEDLHGVDLDEVACEGSSESIQTGTGSIIRKIRCPPV
jgi:hypothetical protein